EGDRFAPRAGCADGGEERPMANEGLWRGRTRIWFAAVGILGIGLLSASLFAGRGHAAFPGQPGKIVFDSDRGASVDIYTMNADGSGVTPLTSDPGEDSRASFSADGKRIVFRSDRAPHTGNPEIYVMNADGSGQTRLTTTGNESRPAFSPDGSK